VSGVYILLGLAAAAAALALLLPIVRRGRVAERSSFDLAVYKDQLAELDRDRARGLLGEAEAKAARLEIERRILKVARAGRDELRATRAGRATALAAGLLAPAIALLLYGVTGSPTLPDRPFAAREEPGSATGRPDVGAMVAQLEGRLAQDPTDVRGWLMLGRSRMVLQKPEAAVDAYRKAAVLAPGDPEALAGLGEALIAAAGGIVTPPAKEAFTKLAEVAPSDPRADFYIGLAELQAGEPKAAMERWRELLARNPADAPWRPQVEAQLREAAAQAGADPEAVLAEAEGTRPATAQGPSAADMERFRQMSPEERDAAIRGMVADLEARLEESGGDAQGWARLGHVRQVLGEPAKARAAWEKAVALSPQDPQILKGYAASLLGPEDPQTMLPEVDDRAEEVYRRLASLRPDDPEPFWYLGIHALQRGAVAEARANWEKVLAKLDPTHPDYASIKARLDALGG
jgi:cytochrome c-type biogenesis protein CcmH